MSGRRICVACALLALPGAALAEPGPREERALVAVGVLQTVRVFGETDLELRSGVLFEGALRLPSRPVWVTAELGFGALKGLGRSYARTFGRVAVGAELRGEGRTTWVAGAFLGYQDDDATRTTMASYRGAVVGVRAGVETGGHGLRLRLAVHLEDAHRAAALDTSPAGWVEPAYGVMAAATRRF